VISGHDMTVEATLAKLFYLLSVEKDVERVKKRMGQDLCGELTSVVAQHERVLVLK
jgi:L-asparaginase